MSRFYGGPLAIVLSLACIADFRLYDGRIAAAPAHAAVQDRDDVSRGSASQPDRPRPDPRRYRCRPGADAVDTITNCEGVEDRRDDDFWKFAVAAVVAIIIALLLKRTVFRSGDRPAAERTLIEDGPQLPVAFPEGTFAVQGFAQDGWPLVVDFEPQPGTVTELQLTVGTGGDARTRKLLLDPDGSRGRQLLALEIPDTGGAREPVPATYAITSLPIAAFDLDRPRTAEPAPLRIFGIGAGPRAVGSVAIERIAFTPAFPGARFGYVAKSEFTRARAQVQRLERDDGTIRVQPVFDSVRSNLAVGPQIGAWPGTVAGTSDASRGPHRLQVTGWFTTDDRSWVAALAPDLVVQ